MSSTASSRTIRKRSSVIEHVITKISTGSIANRENQNSKDIITQQTSLIKQNKENFVVSARSAGLKVVSKFDIKDVAALKAKMPMAQIRLLKRAFSDTFGFDIFGSEKKLRDYLGTLEMAFEAGIYTTSGEDPNDVSFVRITDVNVVLRKMIDELVSSKLFTSLPNTPNQELYLLLSRDKGGNSTKLMLQILNTKSSQSVRTAKLIEIFKGEKDNHEFVEAIFGSVIKEIQEFAHKIESFHLKCPFSLYSNLSSTSTGKESTRTEFLNLNATSNIPDQLGKLDNENMYASPDCVLCNHDHNSSRDDANSHNAPMSTEAPTTETTEESNEFNQCLLVLGGGGGGV